MSEKAQNWTYTEQFALESEVIVRARERGAHLGCPSISPGTGATLRLLAHATQAKAVVEIGTGTGVAALWLLEGMAPDGVLTTIDSEIEFHRAAKEAFIEAGIKPTRTRTISGKSHEVLPRLADAAYDIIFVGTDTAHYANYVTQAERLLRPGGTLVLDNALWYGKVADPANREETPALLRGVARELHESPNWHVALLPTGNGLLCATRTVPAR
ncbi:O-methyltransferase [Populibacterium corticicola]|uniref:O-methyltransferase n=1 Tax=Populibacterium corticicola TaxID=1812826 RepID=A0ABW5XEZ6_9MICO